DCLNPRDLLRIVNGKNVDGAAGHLATCKFCQRSLAALRKVMAEAPATAQAVQETPDPVGEWIMSDSPVSVRNAPPAPPPSVGTVIGFTGLAHRKEDWPALRTGLRPWLPGLLARVGLGAEHTDGFLNFLERQLPIPPGERFSTQLPRWVV